MRCYIILLLLTSFSEATALKNKCKWIIIQVISSNFLFCVMKKLTLDASGQIGMKNIGMVVKSTKSAFSEMATETISDSVSKTFMLQIMMQLKK